MGIVADRLDGMVINASSADGRIDGTYSLRDGVTIHFGAGAFREYTERGLEYQLSALAQRWWAGYRRQCEMAIAEATGRPVVRAEPWDANERRFRAEVDQTVAEGMSTGEYVFFQHTGSRDWRVVVRDGALAELDEFAFAAEVASGHAGVIRDFKVKVAGLRRKHLGHHNRRG